MITTAVAWLKAGFFISTHTLFCVVGVVCVRCNKQTHFVLGSIFRRVVAFATIIVLFFVALDPDPALAAALACALD